MQFLREYSATFSSMSYYVVWIMDVAHIKKNLINNTPTIPHGQLSFWCLILIKERFSLVAKKVIHRYKDDPPHMCKIFNKSASARHFAIKLILLLKDTLAALLD